MTTIVRPCTESSTCPDDSPIDNFSSEASDGLDYIATFYAGNPPPLLKDWSATECGQTFISKISQLDADLQARAAAQLCLVTKECPGCPIFLNRPQTCCVTCPDGSSSCFTVPGGIFTDVSQSSADSLAYLVACNLAQEFKLCLGSLPSSFQCSAKVSNQITVTGGSGPYSFSLAGGSLPTGLTLSPSGLLSGTTTNGGDFTFLVKATSAVGSSTQKFYTITVSQCVTPPNEYWMMPESGNSDRVGSIIGLHLASTLSPLSKSCGEIGNGLYFGYSVTNRQLLSGSGDWSQLSYISTNGYSVAYWMYICGMPQNLHGVSVLWDRLDAGNALKGGLDVFFNTFDSGLTLTIGSYNVRGNGVSGPAINKVTTFNAWHHVVCTYDPVAALFSFFVDGVLIGTQATVVPWPNGTHARPSINFEQTTEGVFDEVGVWTGHALTQSEVSALYSAGRGARPSGVTPTSDPPIVPPCTSFCTGTKVTLTSSASTVNYGENLVLTATANNPLVTGTTSFFIRPATLLGTATMVAGVATLTVPCPPGGVGNFNFYATVSYLTTPDLPITILNNFPNPISSPSLAAAFASLNTAQGGIPGDSINATIPFVPAFTIGGPFGFAGSAWAEQSADVNGGVSIAMWYPLAAGIPRPRIVLQVSGGTTGYAYWEKSDSLPADPRGTWSLISTSNLSGVAPGTITVT